MGKIFRWDSPFTQKLALLSNLILLNILWLLCSLPVVTMGAATTALYYVIFQYQTADETAVIKPFFRSFAKNFVQSTLLWLPMLVILAVMIVNVRYLFAYGAGNLVGIAIIVASVLFLLVQPQLLPQIARFETTLGAVVKNAVLLTILHMPSAFIMTALNVMPVIIIFLFPVEFMRWLPLWVGVYFALVAYINGRMLLKLWAKHMPQEDSSEDEA